MIKREHWGSRLGFILAAAGSAVGLGNIWKFPYMAGVNGGGAFLLIYLALVFTIGVSVMLAEMVIGRMAEKNAIGAFKKLKGGAWPLVGLCGVWCRLYDPVLLQRRCRLDDRLYGQSGYRRPFQQRPCCFGGGFCRFYWQ
jgi:hypothetical protein